MKLSSNFISRIIWIRLTDIECNVNQKYGPQISIDFIINIKDILKIHLNKI